MFTGYSSIAMAQALPPDGRLVACDRDPKSLALAQEYWERAGVADKVRLCLCSAAALTALCARIRDMGRLCACLGKPLAAGRDVRAITLQQSNLHV